MNFKTFQLIIGEDHPTASDLKKVADTGKFVFNTKTELFEVQNRFVEDRFFGCPVTMRIGNYIEIMFGMQIAMSWKIIRGQNHR